MANLSNINNKFIVTDGGNGRVLIGATNDIGATLFANHPSTTAPSLTFNAPAGQVFENEDLQIAFGLNNASPYNGYMQTRFVSAPYYRNLAINPLGGNVGIGTNSPTYNLVVSSGGASGVEFAIATATGLNEMLSYNRSTSVFEKFRAQAKQFEWYTDATANALVIQSGGNVGIGTNSPSRKLVVAQSDVTEPSGIDANTGILIKNNTWSGIQIISTEATGGFITFGDNAAGFAGRIQYLHASNAMVFETAAAEALRIDSSGNVGIGVSPNANWNTLTPLQIKNAALSGFANSMYLTQNVYYDGAFKYIANDFASKIQADQGITFSVAGTGTANNAISFINALTIDSSGNVGIVTTSPSSYYANANNLVVGSHTGSNGISILAATNQTGWLVFADSTAGGDNTRGAIAYNHDDNSMTLRVNNNPAIVIDTNRNVGIGTVSPTQKLDVAGIVKHEGLDMTSGYRVDQVTTFNVTLVASANTWTDIPGIVGSDIPSNGHYMVGCYSNARGTSGWYYVYWTTYMAWNLTSGTNTTEFSEMPLTYGAHSTNGNTLQLRTSMQNGSGGTSNQMRIQFKVSFATTGTSLRLIFRKMIE